MNLPLKSSRSFAKRQLSFAWKVYYCMGHWLKIGRQHRFSIRLRLRHRWRREIVNFLSRFCAGFRWWRCRYRFLCTRVWLVSTWSSRDLFFFLADSDASRRRAGGARLPGHRQRGLRRADRLIRALSRRTSRSERPLHRWAKLLLDEAISGDRDAEKIDKLLITMYDFHISLLCFLCAMVKKRSCSPMCANRHK
jgi:hypothetical protein